MAEFAPCPGTFCQETLCILRAPEMSLLVCGEGSEEELDEDGNVFTCRTTEGELVEGIGMPTTVLGWALEQSLPAMPMACMPLEHNWEGTSEKLEVRGASQRTWFSKLCILL